MPQIYGLANSAPPTPVANGAQVQPRANRRGELFVAPHGTPFSNGAIEGTRFAAANPTFGTAIAGAITAAFGDTTPLCLLRNTDAVGGKYIIVDYVKFFYTVVPASATSAEFGVTIDNTNRYTSGGTQLTSNNVNIQDGFTSVCNIYFGAITASAASGSVRRFYRDKIKHAAPVVGDEVVINFGASDTPAGAASGAAANLLPVPVGPLVVPPQHSALIHVWHPANAVTGPSFECDISWSER